MKLPPCSKDCPDRFVGCHGKCVAYMEYWHEHQEELKRRTERCKVHQFVYDSIYRSKTSTREGKEKYA
jgi:hypothetical protein